MRVHRLSGAAKKMGPKIVVIFHEWWSDPFSGPKLDVHAFLDLAECTGVYSKKLGVLTGLSFMGDDVNNAMQGGQVTANMECLASPSKHTNCTDFTR